MPGTVPEEVEKVIVDDADPVKGICEGVNCAWGKLEEDGPWIVEDRETESAKPLTLVSIMVEVLDDPATT